MAGPSKFCDGVTRRNALRMGMASWVGGGVSLAGMLQARAEDATTPTSTYRQEISTIVIFLNGGLSTIDTFDLKPEAPAEFRGEYSPIATNVPGMMIGEHLPMLAQHADKYALLRSFTHRNSDHGPADHYMLTGYHPTPAFNPNLKPNNERPSHGAIISKMLGPRGSVPPYVCLPRMHNSAGSAYLGSNSAPFVVEADPNTPNFSVPDLLPPFSIDGNRLTDRQGLLSKIDRYRKSAELTGNRHAQTLNAFQQRAFDLMTSPETREAFSIDKEPRELRDAYGRNSLGQGCLMARRLIESGVRCVYVDHANWDTHNNNFHILKNDLLPQLDPAMTMLLKDLAERDILKTTLVILMGEFGRTPRVNGNAGRDHWGPSNCLLLAGGGIKGGCVIGATNSRGEKPDADPVGPEDLSATIYRLLGIDPDVEFRTPEGRPVKIVNNGRVITDLLV
ncbi:MAG: DUF1501 domain-containing protein [Planctomycetaceae bacterium]